MSWKDSLNESQLQAAEQIDGPVLILAGAGSGKTKTLTQRICHMIESGISAKEILAITFTNKAAKEMTDRIANLLEDAATQARPKTCTFHSLGFEIIKEFGTLIGYRPHIGICDEDDRKKRIKQTLKFVEEINEHKEETLTKDKVSFETLSDYISNMKDLCNLPDECNNIPYKKNDVLSKDDLTLGYSIYQASLMEDNQVDFDDLIMNAVRILEKDSIAKKFWRRYKYISVDEYQDTSKAQFRMVYRLAEGNRNICVVGDDYQSIYAFRGADITNILSFQNVYPDAKVVILGENYRSTPQIVDGASAVIANNPDQMEKELFSMNPDGKPITVASFEYYANEADYIARKIRSGINKGKEAGEYAVLYRSNASSRFIEDAFLKYEIPYVIYGGVSFYARKEIKDIVSYIRLAAGYDDRVSFERIANIPKRGLGKKAMADAKEGMKKEDGSLLKKLYEYSKTVPNKKGLTGLAEQLAKYRIYALNYDLATAIRMIIEDIKYFDYLHEEYADEEDGGDSRIQNVQELVSKAEEFCKDYVKSAPNARNEEIIEAFLESIALLTDADRNKDDGKCVKLMTMHTSKGLEFNTVFMVACEERSTAYSEQELYEERRLFYVAMTRAKKKLFISWSEKRFVYGHLQPRDPICFISEIPSNVVRVVSDTASTYATNEKSKAESWYMSL